LNASGYAPPRVSPRRGISIAGQRFINLDPVRFGARRGGRIGDPELHPHHLGPDRDRLIDDGSGGLAAAEDVDHVDRAETGGGSIGERRVAFLAEERGAGGRRIYRDRAVALALQIAHHAVARPLRARAGADHGDRADAGQDAAEIVVGIGCMVHTRSLPPRRRQWEARLPPAGKSDRRGAHRASDNRGGIPNERSVGGADIRYFWMA
jgi:hypothetical protein